MNNHHGRQWRVIVKLSNGATRRYWFDGPQELIAEKLPDLYELWGEYDGSVVVATWAESGVSIIERTT